MHIFIQNECGRKFVLVDSSVAGESDAMMFTRQKIRKHRRCFGVNGQLNEILDTHSGTCARIPRNFTRIECIRVKR